MQQKQDGHALQKIVQAAQAGDEHAFEALMDVIEVPIYRLALAMTRCREDAEDAAQETLIKLWRSLPSYRFECPILPYALQVARNTTLDFLRRKRSDRLHMLPMSEDSDGRAILAELPDPDENINPAHAYARRERAAEVRRAIDELPQELREILVLKDIQGLSYEQIGQALALKDGTVKSRLSRARKKLSEILRTRNIF